MPAEPEPPDLECHRRPFGDVDPVRGGPGTLTNLWPLRIGARTKRPSGGRRPGGGVVR